MNGNTRSAWRAFVIAGGFCLWGLSSHPSPAAAASSGSLTKMEFGKTPDGTPVDLYVLKNGQITVKVTNYGGIITEISTPDRNGKLGDIALGFENLEGYLGKHPFFGATVGRVANRIAKGTFTLNGQDYKLAINNGPNALHGGLKGFDKKVWKAEEVKTDDGPSVRMSYRSADGEEGYPGNLDVTVQFTVTADNGLKIDYTATTDRATPINLSNHSYFNLAGRSTESILDHDVQLIADRYTPVDDTLIPTGEIAEVAGTPLDFRKAKPIGQDIKGIKADPVGYDHNFVLNSRDRSLALGARVHDPKTGRILEMFTTQPGVQFYTGNFLDGTVVGKDGIAYRQYAGFCLESQHYPDSIHHPNFPSAVLEPGQAFRETTVFKFSAK
ncbi:aldose epimerase family protein [Aquisphaera insulae]|uniref:aldose epimerase family protein n=1 Tax=Aquisphaera insulae TaxID=2712864 RepID=UPI00196B091D|nr:aldose epimerase family protein [Aquisphaera insulae]